MKDNICSAQTPTTCGSSILDGFRSPFAADVVRRIEEAGGIVSGTTNLDEFGMGSDSLNSTHGPVRNSFSERLSAGGSSGGSAVAVATNQCFAALGTDTGGSVRLPASYNGIVGFKPSYGFLSRWGLIAYANSLDTVGIMGKKVGDVRQLYVALKDTKRDNDPTSLSQDLGSRIMSNVSGGQGDGEGKRLRIGVPIEYNTAELMPSVRTAWIRTLNLLQSAGHLIYPTSLPTTRLALSAYYVLAPAEASSNLARYDGVRYGKKSQTQRPSTKSAAQSEHPELLKELQLSSPPHAGEKFSPLYSYTRGDGLGDEVRRRILLGAYSLSAGAIDNYFIQAQKVRRKVQQDFNSVFRAANPLIDTHPPMDKNTDVSSSVKVDFILTPTAQSLAPEIDTIRQRDPVDTYSADVLTVPASLAGLPAISVPVPLGEEVPGSDVATTTGMQIIGQVGTDEEVLDAAETMERIFDSNPI